MSEPDPRTDVYTLAALLSELDRLLCPLLRGARGRVRLGPTFPPPLPSFEGPTSPATGFGRPNPSGAGSSRGASRPVASGPSRASGTHRPQRFAAPAVPPLRPEPVTKAATLPNAASPSSEVESSSSQRSPIRAPLAQAPGDDRSDERLPGPLRHPAPKPSAAAAPAEKGASRPLDHAARAHRPLAATGRAQLPAPAPAPTSPWPSGPSEAFLPPRLPPPSSARPRPKSPPPALPKRALDPWRLDLPRATPARANAPPPLPLGATPPRAKLAPPPEPERREPPERSRAPEATSPRDANPDASSSEEPPKASVELQALETEDETFVPALPAVQSLPRSLAPLSLRRGGRLSLSPRERQRVIHKLGSAFLDRALMRQR